MSIRRWGTITETQAEDTRQILKSLHLLTKIPGGAVIKRGYPRVRPGTLLRQVKTGGIGGDQYYWMPVKAAKVEASPAPTDTVFYVRNPAFLAGDTVTVGAEAGNVIASMAYVPDTTGGPGKFKVTLTAAIAAGAPAAGARVFSATAAEMVIDALSLEELPYLADSDQACEVAISGIFLKTAMDQLYHATDITAWLARGAVTNHDVLSTFIGHDAYRWT